MADGSSQADIRGIDIDKLAKGFADEENVFKSFVTVSTTAAREMRWQQKTSGFLDSTDTTGITASQIANTSSKSLPVVVEQTWTRNTSYVRKYFVESPLLSMEDINDSDVDILATNVRDLTRAVARQVDARIYDVITESQSPSNILSTAATATWDNGTPANIDIIADILTAKQKIRSQGYNPEGAILAMNPIEHRLLMTWLISTKGSSIPQFASEKVESGVVMNLLGTKIVVSENAITDSVAMWVPTRSATWKAFMPIKAVTIVDEGIGTKIRCFEEGECLLTDPKSVHLITNTIT